MLNNNYYDFVITICMYAGQLRSQGIISSSFVNNSDFQVLSWEQPFSLNITNVEPDVVYIVEMYRLNTTCFDHQHLLLSEFTVFQPYLEFAVPRFPYEVIVTPRSNLEGARNGISSTYSGNNSNEYLCIQRTLITTCHVVTDYVALDIKATTVLLNDSDININGQSVNVELHLSGKVN